MRTLTRFILAIFLLWTIDYGLSTKCGAINVYAAVPHLINYQGRLTDSGGTPLNGSYSLTFRIYDAETAGNLLWEETHTGVVIQKGIFSILLGSVTNLDLPFDKPYFLEIKVGNEVMSPRQRITSAGYAIRAEKAEGAEKIKTSSNDTVAGYLDTKVKNSIEVNNNQLQLKGDSEISGNNKYYGTDGSGNKGFYPLVCIFSNIQLFTSSGTWTKPAGVSKVWVKCWGGGGGGGGLGGGGGGASYAEGLVTVTGDVSVTVGSGGAGGLTNMTNGGNGGQSSFGTDIVAGGGDGGLCYYKEGGGGGGGIATTGTIKLSGVGGGHASYDFDSGGVGGSAPFGGSGGRGGVSSVRQISQHGAIPGGGGGGGGGVGGNPEVPGGNGGAGLVIIYW